MPIDENKTIVRRFFDEVYNHNNLAVCDELQEPEYATFQREWIPMLRRAFPDLHVTVDDLVAEEDKVVAAITVRGTHEGTLSGELIQWLTDPVPPTGNRIEVKGIFIYPIVNGKIAAVREGIGDWLALLQQLKVIPSPITTS